MRDSAMTGICTSCIAEDAAVEGGDNSACLPVEKPNALVEVIAASCGVGAWGVAAAADEAEP